MKKALLLLVLVWPAINLQAAEPRPGLWNLSVTTTAEGADGVFGPYTSSQCLTEEDVRNPEKLLAENGVNACTYGDRSEEHTSELQSLMRISYAVCCLKK